MSDDQDFLLDQLIAYLPLGRRYATPAGELASNLGISTRKVGNWSSVPSPNVNTRSEVPARATDLATSW